MLGTRQRLMSALTSVFDGTGMPVDTGRMLADATAEAGRGLAPLTAAAAVGATGVRLGAKGSHWLLIGRRPDREQLARWRKPTADGDPDAGAAQGGPGDATGGSGSAGPRRPGGPPDRYRDEDGQVVDGRTGEVLHDQNSDRTLLSTRAHNRLVRFRGYRILHRGGRAAYGATAGLPENVRRLREGHSRYSHDARQQVRVWGNTVREDAQAWAAAGRHVSRTLRENTDDSGGPGPFAGRRLPAVTSSATPGRPDASRRPVAGATPPAARRAATGTAGAAARPERRSGAAAATASGAAAAALPGGSRAGSAAREEARLRMQELMRRTEPEVERLRQERARARDEDGEGE
jgi:hypothetical protein